MRDFVFLEDRHFKDLLPLLGFTLAEVLITLGIIGIVAAMTLPMLIQKYQEKVIITKVKKDYSIIEQALQNAQAHFETPGNNAPLYNSAPTTSGIAAEFAKYIPGAHLCISASDKLCKNVSHKVIYTNYNKNKTYTLGLPAIILPDGGTIHMTLEQRCVDTEVSGHTLDADGEIVKNEDGSDKMWTGIRNSCGSIFIDIDGGKGENYFGYDAFGLTVWTNRIGKGYWDVYGTDSLYSVLTRGKLIYNLRRQ